MTPRCAVGWVFVAVLLYGTDGTPAPTSPPPTNCTSLTSCISCTSQSSLKCAWCLTDHKCHPQGTSSQACPNYMAVTRNESCDLGDCRCATCWAPTGLCRDDRIDFCKLSPLGVTRCTPGNDNACNTVKLKKVTGCTNNNNVTCDTIRGEEEVACDDHIITEDTCRSALTLSACNWGICSLQGITGIQKCEAVMTNPREYQYNPANVTCYSEHPVGACAPLKIRKNFQYCDAMCQVQTKTAFCNNDPIIQQATACYTEGGICKWAWEEVPCEAFQPQITYPVELDLCSGSRYDRDACLAWPVTRYSYCCPLSPSEPNCRELPCNWGVPQEPWP